MENTTQLLEGYSDEEKGAYIGAIASIATADREVTEDEMEYISGLSDAANLSEQQKETILTGARGTSGSELTHYLNTLKNSELRFSLVTDLISFAKADGNYSEAEEGNVKKVADYLGLSDQQFSVLDKVVEKTSSADITPEQAASPNFLSSLGMDDQVRSSGINSGGLFKSLLGMAGPMILAGLVSKGLRGRSNSGGGLLGNLGGMFGGSRSGGGMLGGGGMMGGGLGSLIGMLSGGRGMSSNGGLLGRLLGRRY